jgi:hypothetical protein
MLNITLEYKKNVVAALLDQRKNFDGSDGQFAKQYDINSTVFSRLKTGSQLDGLLRDAQWLSIGRLLEVGNSQRKWNVARTDVFTQIEQDIIFCQEHSKSLMFVDECGIGKSFTGKYLARTRKNCFYIDGRQATTKQAFVRLIAKTIGVDDKGKYLTVKANIKHALNVLPNPIVIIDEAGAPEYNALMEILEFWNATEDTCGWYLMGADGLRDKVERGFDNKKVGFAELFSRFNERYNSIVPIDRQDKLAFYTKLISDVLTVNMENKGNMKAIVKKCLTNDSGRISGLRRAKSLLLLNS